MRITSFFALLMIGFVTPLDAAEPLPVELIISAQAIESPVLKYRLLPGEAELKPGNAATILLRLPWEQTRYFASNEYQKLGDWESRPLTSPEWSSFPASWKNRFNKEMRRAAFRREASWEYPLDEPSPFILIPDAAVLHHLLGRGLSANVRYHLSRGELDQAREAIQVGFANARHIARTPLVVNQMIAGSIHRTMLDRTAELISQPASPNLYWSLGMLPGSLLEFQRAADFEPSAFGLNIPAASDLDQARSEAEWKRTFEQLCEAIELTEQPEKSTAEVASRKAAIVKTARQELPQLLPQTRDKIAAMSDEEIALRWFVTQSMQHGQRAAAVVCLPPIEAWPHLKELHREAASIHEKTGSTIGGFDPLPSYVSVWSLERKIQALRIIEAVRHHLAQSGGKLPENLADIQGLSIPLDPLTNQPFEWRAAGKTAVLKGPALPPEAPSDIEPRATFLEYRLAVR